MTKLVVKHLDHSDPAQFIVVRADGKTAGPITVPSLVGFPVEGQSGTHLMQEVWWYLETFLDYRFSPWTEKADRIKAALNDWGIQAFNALFLGRSAGRILDAATSNNYADLQLEISSDDPRVLYWSWEALRDAEVGVLARTCQMSRHLNKTCDPRPLLEKLPRDGVNIWLVTARPYQSDVNFRSISRPLIDLIAKEKLPARVTLLRPPTSDQLRAHLHANPGHYHIVPFDGHGGYGTEHEHDSSQPSYAKCGGRRIWGRFRKLTQLSGDLHVNRQAISWCPFRVRTLLGISWN